MKNLNVSSVLVLCMVLIISSCKTKVAPTSERIKKIWTAKAVSENGTEVYKTGGTTNLKPGYSTYRLDLSTPPKAIIRDVDGGTYTGSYTVPSNDKVSITGLSPEPTGTGGKLDFTVKFVTDLEIQMSSTTPYPKTGNTTNIYTLVTQ
jgi:hypothetical protein